MSSRGMSPPKPIASADVAWTEWPEVPRFTLRYRHLSRAALGEYCRIGVAIEALPPASRPATASSMPAMPRGARPRPAGDLRPPGEPLVANTMSAF